MTDERLDQILKQALAPEIADTEIAVKQAGRNYYMKNYGNRSCSSCMCCTSCGRDYRSRTPDGTKGTGSSQHFQKSVCHLCTGGGTDKDKPVYIKESVSNTFGYAAWDDGKTGKMGFVMEMPLSVKGDDIKTISYHIENGFFR